MATAPSLGIMCGKGAGVLGLAVLTAVLAAGAASAETTAPAERIELILNGEVAPACDLQGGGDVDLGELKGGRGFSARLGFYCNVPFDVTLKSENGGLAHETLPGGEGPYVGLLPYRLKLEVPVVTPVKGRIAGDYASGELRGSRSLSSGSGIAVNGATLALVTEEPGGAGLLAGNYRETINFTVAPRP